MLEDKAMELEQYMLGFEKHLRILQGLADSTVRLYCTNIDNFFHRKTDLDNINSLKRKDIEDYLEHCFYQGNNNQTRLTKLISLRKFFKYLFYEGIINEDITTNIPRPRARRGLVQKFTKKEILEIFRKINITTEKGIRDTAMIILGAFCGLRISEIIKLRLNDIIDEGKSMTLNIMNTKHGASRTVSLWKAPSIFIRQWLAIRLFQSADKNAPFLISYRKGDNVARLMTRLTPAGIDQIFKKYAASAGIRKPVVTMHMLRATHASDLRYIRGYDIFTIMDRLGHKDVSTTGRYIPVRDRISREYQSLAAYWSEFPHLWNKEEDKNALSDVT